MSSDLEMRRRRASFRARHRGTKEIELLLGRFADARLPEMSGPQLDVFERLIEQPDPELQGWIMVPHATPRAEFAALIEELRKFHSLAGSPA